MTTIIAPDTLNNRNRQTTSRVCHIGEITAHLHGTYIPYTSPPWLNWLVRHTSHAHK
jgi:hypothetical protein